MISDPDAAAAAQAMLARFVESWNAVDGFAYGEGYWDDAELVDPTGRISSGRNAIVQGHVDLWAGPFKGSRIAGTVRRIQRLSASLLIVDVDLALGNVNEVPPGAVADEAGLIRCHLKHVLTERAGVWRILSAQNTFIAYT